MGEDARQTSPFAGQGQRPNPPEWRRRHWSAAGRHSPTLLASTAEFMPTSTASSARVAHRRRGARRARRIALAGVVVVLLGAALALGALRLVRSGALPGVHVGSAQVGGLGDAELVAALERYAERRAGEEVSTRLEDHPADHRVRSTAGEMGFQLDTSATVEAVLRRGRQTNPVAALADHVRAFVTTIPVAPVQRMDDPVLETWLEQTADALTQAPIEGTLEFDGASFTRVDPQPGAEVRRDELRARARAAALTEGSVSITAQADALNPETTREDVDALVPPAQRALSAPVRLSRNETTITFTPAQIGDTLVVAREGSELRLDVDADAVADAVAPETIEAVEQPAVDAGFVVAGASVDITPSREGFRFDDEAAAQQLLELATGEGPREATLDGEVLEPERTTAEAEQLGIVEPVSSFTTNFQPGQSRVTNIQRIADLVDGVVLAPGETFSVNGHVGPRTREKGFVGGGAIFDGEFVEQVGGGVSQFATTLYNAAYFGGYAIPDFKAHSYYISRYPVGREATLNYPDVDLKVRNNSPHGALLSTSHTDSSVTVSFYGTTWVEVESITGERENVTAPETRVRETDELPPGEERVAQSGRDGFDITVTRVLRFPDGRVERQEVFTRYVPEPRIVERGT